MRHGHGTALLLTVAVLGCGAEVASRAQPDAAVEPHVLVSGQQRPWALALDDSHVYFTAERAPGWLRGVAKAGGTPSDLATVEPGQQAQQVGLSAGALYYWETGQQLSRVPVGGGASSQLWATATNVIVNSGAMTTHNRVFWVEEQAGIVGYSLSSVAVDGAAPKRIAFPGLGVARGVPPVNLRAAQDVIYVGLSNSGGVFVFPLDGSRPTAISTGSDPATLGAIDDSFLFLATADGVISVPRQGGPPAPILTGLRRPSGLAVDDAYLYVAENIAAGRILKVRKAGGQPTVLASGQGSPRAIVVDDTNVYWTCVDEGSIKTIAK